MMEIQMWKDFLNPYELAVEELLTKFNHLIKEYREKGYYSSIERVEGRVKSIASILDKCQKKGITVEEIEQRLEDIAGVRLICRFVQDIEQVAELLRHRSDLTIRQEKDYVTTPKDSGYRSYHMIAEYQVETMNGPKRIMVELQIRTMAMDYWATIEHSLQYKYKLQIPEEIQERLMRVSEATVLLDKEMSQVRLEIMDAQNAFSRQSQIVAEILNTIRKLSHIIEYPEMKKLQDRFYQIYSMNNLEQLESFEKQLNSLAEKYQPAIYEE